MPSKFTLLLTIGLLLIVMLGVSWLQLSQRTPQPTLEAKHTDGFTHPTQVMKHNDGFIIAQMTSPNLLLKTLLGQGDMEVFTRGQGSIRSPHFLAPYQGGVFVSEGRGHHIIFHNKDGEIEQPHITEGIQLNRPHGICIDDDWLYIADSVNSRLVRVNLIDRTFDVFKDTQRKVAYGRQLLCREDGLWLANSYEKAFTLNPGQGGNVLHIKEFASGEVDEIVSFEQANVTGLAVLDDQMLVVGRWSGHYDLITVDLDTRSETQTLTKFERQLDAPYGITVDAKLRRFYVSFLGLNRQRKKGEDGGVLEFSY